MHHKIRLLLVAVLASVSSPAWGQDATEDKSDRAASPLEQLIEIATARVEQHQIRIKAIRDLAALAGEQQKQHLQRAEHLVHSAEAETQAAEARYKLTQRELQRLRELVKKAVVNDAEADAAQARMDAAGAEYKRARANIEEAKIEIEVVKLSRETEKLEQTARIAEATIEMLDAKQQLIELQREQSRARQQLQLRPRSGRRSRTDGRDDAAPPRDNDAPDRDDAAPPRSNDAPDRKQP